MSTLKDKLENYTSMPDDKVWEGIDATMKQKMVRRRMLTASSVAVVGVGTVALLFALSGNRQPNMATESSQVIVASNNSGVPSQQIVVSDETDKVTVINNSLEKTSPVMSSDFAPSQDDLVTAVPDALSDEVKVDDASVHAQPSVEATVPVQENVETGIAAVPASKPMQAVRSAQDMSEARPERQEPQKRINPMITNAELVVWIPNAFSPDDPVEESARTFKVFPNNDASIRTFEIYIYSRSGRLVYHSKDFNQGWDGTANGQPQPMGTYVYVIELNDAVKGLQHTKGSVTLIR